MLLAHRFEYGGVMSSKTDFKFDVITHSSANCQEDMLKYFLADTIEEAEDVFRHFSSILNHLAYNYAISTGLQKADLFGEGIIGLGRAKRDWDSKRGGEFRPYAVFRIKDAMMEFIRNNHTIVNVPSYVKKANLNLKKVMSVCEELGLDYKTVILTKSFPNRIKEKDIKKCLNLIEKISSAAERAGVDYAVFIERIEFLPKETELSNLTQEEEINEDRNQEITEAALIVSKLKEMMDDVELKICNGIMMGKSYDEIGKELGHCKSWVSEKLDSFRNRVKRELYKGGV